MKIGLLEDDTPLAEMMSLWLTAARHTTFHYATVNAFRRNIDGDSPDLIIVDRMLPDGDGIDALKWFRKSSLRCPVLFASALGAEADIVAALDAGADDYVVKPLRQEELLARVRALLRRTDTVVREVIECGPVTLDSTNRTALLAGQPVVLTDREFDLSSYLLQNLGRLVSRAELLKQVWGTSASLATRTVDTHASQIRQKLGLTPENGFTLKAVYGHGYRLQYDGDRR